ncbi:hypothetical protein P4S95_10430 [Aneurinibacillus aneurinilyticus]|uniref:hypothetical protein n=1 Tax=Aneurinibacillus aneurinilyticus TaxID=1391 RepID=UPI002E249FE6|nr:hypothetical protein [Aneurinibacillus aneurinilyticus]
MPVQIIVNGENATQAIQEFAILSAAFKGQVVSASASVSEEPKAEELNSEASVPASEEPKPRQRRTPKKDEAPKEAPATTQPEPEESQDSDKAEAVPDVVELRAKAKEKGSTAEGKKAIKALLDKFGSKSISDVPEEKRAAFLAALEEI